MMTCIGSTTKRQQPRSIAYRAQRLRPPGRLTATAAVAVGLLQFSSACFAIDIDTGNEDLKVRWDNTLKYSAAARLKNPSAMLTSPSANANNANLDDGDRNFKKGLISNRLDLLSEFDVSYKDNHGLRLSAAGWYDDVYNGANDNPGFAGGAFPNQLSVPHNKFVSETRKIHGRGAEVLDAFVYSGFDVGADGRASVRLGRHGMVWGETLFFGANGIAGGMMPVDVVKLVSVPNTQFKEAIRPVPMVSGQWQVTPQTALGAYYQFRWAPSRIPAVGSYFSPADTLPAGAERLLLAGPGSPFLADAPRLGDLQPKDSGQGGVQLRSRAWDTDFGAYLIRYHDKVPQQVINVGAAPVASCAIPGSFPTSPGSCALPGPVSYRLAYPEAITSLGFSASKTFGDVNLATEASFRKDQPLNSGRNADISALTGGPAANNSNNPGYAVARTAHLNVSALWSLPPNALFREGTVLAEAGWNRVLSVSRNAALVDPASTRDAVAVRVLLQPVYRQVLAGVDMTPLLGFGWAPKGSRSAITTTGMPQNGNGDVTVGVEVTYQDAWRASLSATHYFGSAGSFLTPAGGGANSISFRQYYADRDFISFSLRRSF